MNAEARSWIAAALKHSSQIQGLEGESWANAKLREVIYQRFGVRIHADMSGKSRLASDCHISLHVGGELMSEGSRHFVPDVPNLDNEARSELLSYLVVSQLVSRSRTEGWLTTVHLAELEQIWLTANGGRCGLADSLGLAKMSVVVAGRVWQLPPFRDAGFHAKFFTDGWRLDYRSSLVRCLYESCRGTVPCGECRTHPLNVQGSAGGCSPCNQPFSQQGCIGVTGQSRGSFERGKTVPLMARQHGMDPNQLFHWCKVSLLAHKMRCRTNGSRSEEHLQILGASTSAVPRKLGTRD